MFDTIKQASVAGKGSSSAQRPHSGHATIAQRPRFVAYVPSVPQFLDWNDVGTESAEVNRQWWKGSDVVA